MQRLASLFLRERCVIVRCLAILTLFGLCSVGFTALYVRPILERRHRHHHLLQTTAGTHPPPPADDAATTETVEYFSDEEMPDGRDVAHNETFRLWADTNDSACSDFETRFGSGMPLRGLLSFPSSGNSWARYLIEAATGIFTGSDFQAGSLFQAGMLGEWPPFDSGWTIVQKSHGFSVGTPRSMFMKPLVALGCDYILLLRHPADAIVSNRHLDQGWQLGFADVDHFQGDSWTRYVKTLLPNWMDFNMERLHACPREHLLVVIYEQLVRDPMRQLRRILRFLSVETDPARMRCLIKYPDGRLKRNHSRSPNIPDPFTDSQKVILQNHVRLINQALQEKGFPIIPSKWNVTVSSSNVTT